MAKIKFTGGMDTQQILRDNPGAHSYANSLALLNDGNFTVHVEPRCEITDCLEWLVSVASQTGRRSFHLLQQTPLSAIYTAQN